MRCDAQVGREQFRGVHLCRVSLCRYVVSVSGGGYSIVYVVHSVSCRYKKWKQSSQIVVMFIN